MCVLDGGEKGGAMSTSRCLQDRHTHTHTHREREREREPETLRRQCPWDIHISRLHMPVNPRKNVEQLSLPCSYSGLGLY